MQGNINGRLNRLLKSYMSPINGKISLKENTLAASYKTLGQLNKRGAIQRQIQLAGPIWR